MWDGCARHSWYRQSLGQWEGDEKESSVLRVNSYPGPFMENILPITFEDLLVLLAIIHPDAFDAGFLNSILSVIIRKQWKIMQTILNWQRLPVTRM